MTRRPTRVDFDAVQNELRALLRGWDPIGVFQVGDPDPWPEDEYDCLIPGLYNRLMIGAQESEIVAFLEHELVDHFGQTPRPDADRQFARELVMWWNTA